MVLLAPLETLPPLPTHLFSLIIPQAIPKMVPHNLEAKARSRTTITTNLIGATSTSMKNPKSRKKKNSKSSSPAVSTKPRHRRLNTSVVSVSQVRPMNTESDESEANGSPLIGKEAAPEARKWLHALEPQVTHLGGVSFRVHSLLNKVDQKGALYLKSPANITLLNLAKSILTRSRILTILGEEDRNRVRAKDPTFRPTEPFPMQPVRGQIHPSHRPLKLQVIVKIGEENLYCLYRMQGDRCIYDTFFFLEDVIAQGLTDKKELFIHCAHLPRDFDEVDWHPFEESSPIP